MAANEAVEANKRLTANSERLALLTACMRRLIILCNGNSARSTARRVLVGLSAMRSGTNPQMMQILNTCIPLLISPSKTHPSGVTDNGKRRTPFQIEGFD